MIGPLEKNTIAFISAMRHPVIRPCITLQVYESVLLNDLLEFLVATIVNGRMDRGIAGCVPVDSACLLSEGFAVVQSAFT